jgi:hypothetical protein
MCLSVPPVDEEASDNAEDESDLSDEKPQKGRKSFGSKRNSITSGGTSLKANDLLKTGKTGLGPDTEVVIKKPKARSAGKIPYTNGTIHPNTMLFLQDLAANNNRSWLKSKEPFYFKLQLLSLRVRLALYCFLHLLFHSWSHPLPQTLWPRPQQQQQLLSLVSSLGYTAST